MGMFFHSADAPAERPADPEVRRANLNRIGRLFAPYKLRLGGVLLLIVPTAITQGAEFAKEVPGFFFNVGVAPNLPRDKIAPNHSPRFMVDEAGLIYGLRAIMHATVDRMGEGAPPAR